MGKVGGRVEQEGSLQGWEVWLPEATPGRGRAGGLTVVPLPPESLQQRPLSHLSQLSLKELADVYL